MAKLIIKGKTTEARVYDGTDKKEQDAFRADFFDRATGDIHAKLPTADDTTGHRVMRERNMPFLVFADSSDGTTKVYIYALANYSGRTACKYIFRTVIPE